MSINDPSTQGVLIAIHDAAIAHARALQAEIGPVDPALSWSIDDLLRPDAFPHEVGALQLRETHISWVILTGSVAYKIKKPVKLDFIDTSTLERRRHFCEEELRLNRRFAPDLYLGVVPVTLREGRAVIGVEGPAVDYAVRMKQFPESEELPALLDRNDVDGAQMTALGQLLAEFHMSAAVAPTMRTPEKTEQICDSMFDTLAQLQRLCSTEQHAGLNRIVAWTRDTARELESTFMFRESDGFIRECHGDLHAANIVRLEGRLVPFDCIEFNPNLRWIDAIDDIAFLVMDLMSHDRPDLAFALLSRYLEITGDYAGVRLLPFYAAYRALVRAKVDALTVHSVPARAAEFRERLERRLRAAASWTTERQPILILMHGPSGAGKTWLSSHLVPEIPAIRIRSDLERKRLAHLGPTQSAVAGVRQGIYAPRFSRRTYGRLADCAENCLSAGFNVIVDASFLEAQDRELFQGLAKRRGIPSVIVSCQADPITLSKQILDRPTHDADASEPTLAVLDAELREFKPFAPSEAPSVIAVDARSPHAVERVLQEIRTRCAR